MHEMSLCESLVRLIEKKAQTEGFTRVIRLSLEIGALSGVSEEALVFCFPFVAKGTVAEGAELVFLHSSTLQALRIKTLEVL